MRFDKFIYMMILLAVMGCGTREERAKAADFGSVDEYAEFVLGEAVREEEETEKEVRKRLRDLGYPH